MIKEDILALKVGTELDKLVAEQIFGKKVVAVKYLSGYTSTERGDPTDKEIYDECYATVFDDGETLLYADYVPDFAVRVDLLEPYSRDPSEAWRVVDKLIDEGFHPSIVFNDKGLWGLSLDGIPATESRPILTVSFLEDVIWCDTVPEAICKAALMTRVEV